MRYPMVATIVVISFLSGCATANKDVLSESIKKSSGNSMTSYAVYPANSEMIQVEFANFVEENILASGGKIYDRNVKFNNAGKNSEDIEVGERSYGFAPLAPVAIAFVTEVISQFSEKKEKEGKGRAELLGKPLITHDITNNPSEYAIFTYASNPSSPSEGRVRIINKKNGEIVANFSVDGSRGAESIFLNAIAKSIGTRFTSSPNSTPGMFGPMK